MGTTTPGRSEMDCTLDEALQYIDQLERDLSEVSYSAALYLERSGHGGYRYQPDEAKSALTALKNQLCAVQGVEWKDVCDLVRSVEEEREESGRERRVHTFGHGGGRWVSTELLAALKGMLAVVDGGHSTLSPDGDQTLAARKAIAKATPNESTPSPCAIGSTGER